MIAAAAALFVACSETDSVKDVVENNETELIGFETYHNKATKASVNAPENLTDANGGFGVYGFKHLNDRAASNGEINLSDVDETNNVNYVTPIFNNVKVWYVSNDFSATPTQGFTYQVPKYWDKLKFYTFFAYAPYAEIANGTTKGIAFDNTKGLFTRNDIIALQDANTKSSVTVNNVARDKYTDANEAGIVDYLIAPYVPHMKKGATNQPTANANAYTGSDLTVGFEFWHLLSKLNVTVKAKDESATNAHHYSGVKDIQVKKLNITNLPNDPTAATTQIATYTQSKVEFATTAALNAAGSFSPVSYDTNLEIIGDGTNAKDAGPLFVLDGGTGSASTVTSNPTTYIDQAFHYFVAPNTPAANTKHELNIEYVINYVDGTSDPFARTIDLSTATANFTTMAQNSIYNITVTIALDQIYFTVDKINSWDPEVNTNVTAD